MLRTISYEILVAVLVVIVCLLD